MVGEEHRLGASGRAIVTMARSAGAKYVATLHVTCSDSREKEGADDFVSTVVRELAEGTYARRSPMRTANLGARYEWGSAPLAAGHFNALGTDGSLLIIKTSTHVGYLEHSHGREYGLLQREHDTSISCGALGCLLDGMSLPFLRDLELMFHSEGMDRLGMLRDTTVVPSEHRPLLASVVNARLQARQAMLDVSEHCRRNPSMAPSQLLVVSSVTMNRQGADNELLVGFYSGVRDETAPSGMRLTWTGLPADPRALQVAHRSSSVSITSDHPFTRWARGPREHRELPLAHLRATAHEPAPAAVHSAVDDAVQAIQADLANEKSPGAKLALAGAAVVIGEVMPVAGLALLFSSGAIGLHHAWRVHRVTSGRASDHEARALFAEVAANMDGLSEVEALQVVERLASELG
ncbi:MAG: hypothetical protein ACJAZ8_001639 [Planctomycetota bacterium]